VAELHSVTARRRCAEGQTVPSAASRISIAEASSVAIDRADAST